MRSLPENHHPHPEPCRAGDGDPYDLSVGVPGGVGH